jgi:hypothetical protein
MRIEGIGTLTPHRDCWRLVYDRCDHVQEFPSVGLEEAEAAAREVRRHYAECLTCRLGLRRPDLDQGALGDA